MYRATPSRTQTMKNKKIIGSRKINADQVSWRGLRDNGGESFAVDSAIGSKYGGTELSDHAGIGLARGRKRRVSQFVGLNQVTAKVNQHFPNMGFPCCEATGEGYL